MNSEGRASPQRFAQRLLILDGRAENFLRLLVNLGGYCTVDQASRMDLADSPKQTRRRLRELQAGGFLRRVTRYPIVYQVTKSVHRHVDRDSRARRSHTLGTVQSRLLAVSFYLAAIRWPARFVFDHAQKVAVFEQAGLPVELLPRRGQIPYLREDFVIRSGDGKLTVAIVDQAHRSAFSQLRGLLRRFSRALKRLPGRLSLAVATGSDARTRLYCKLVKHPDLREHISTKPALTCYLMRRVPEITMLTWPPLRQEHPTKGSAWNAAERLIDENKVQPKTVDGLTVREIVNRYRDEKMPKRADTRRAYNVWLNHYVLPRWGDRSLNEVQARPVELWLGTLVLAPRSKAHVRGVLSLLWDYAMWRGDVPTQRNPMELVTIRGATKRRRTPRSLTVDEFQRFAQHLGEPFRTMALLCVCLGLRISECLALRWSDVDWLNGKLRVERGIVCQQVDDVKTSESRRELPIDASLLEVLKAWKQTTQFSNADDWMFASPVQLGRLPWSYDQIWRVYQKAAKATGIGGLGTHSLRHTYRSWLDSVGTPVGIQQRLMRHADIRTTMNVYGDAATDAMTAAHSKVVSLALNRAQTERKAS